MSKIIFFSVGVGLFLSSAVCWGQEDKQPPEKWASRLELGIGLTKSWAYSTQYNSYMFSDISTEKVFVNDLSHRTSNWGPSGLIGCSFPIYNLSTNTLLSLYTGLRFQLNKYNYSYIPITSPMDFHSKENGTYSTVGLPVGFDLKFSNITPLVTKGIFGTLGVGVMPNVTFYEFNTVKKSWSVNPYIKGEIGLKLGVPLKLQIQYLLLNHKMSEKGDYQLVVNTESYSGIVEVLKLYNRSSLTVSVIALPFSH